MGISPIVPCVVGVRLVRFGSSRAPFHAPLLDGSCHREHDAALQSQREPWQEGLLVLAREDGGGDQRRQIPVIVPALRDEASKRLHVAHDRSGPRRLESVEEYEVARRAVQWT